MRPCPRCDYDLTGLPEEHDCPECGFNYDKHATSIQLPARKNDRQALIFAGGATAFMLISNRTAMFRLPGWALIGITILFLGAMIMRLRRHASLADRMIFSRKGIVFYSPGKSGNLIKWSEVASARCSWWDGQLRMTKPCGLEARCYSNYLLGGVRVAKRCASEINRLKAAYEHERQAMDEPLRQTI